jgi:pimeloyl-ACP methyl ester carboxylesterase
MRLPDELDDLERLADFVEQDLDSYILVGDSFGAVIALALATRQPPRLRGLVLSGGFAKNPLDSLLLKSLSALAPYFPGPFYRALTLRVHAAQLASSFDASGEIPWSARKTREFFVRETPHRAYVNRMRSIAPADYIGRLPRIDVPTLILTPQEDRIIGKDAAGVMLNGIRRSREVVLARTGHMFRFSHPTLYAREVLDFVRGLQPPAATRLDPLTSSAGCRVAG